jgi:hypothetical protein
MFGLLNDNPVAAKAGITIQRPADEVFRFIGVDFFSNYPRWSPEVIELTPLTPGEVRLGTMARQVRVDQGNRSESSFKVTVFEPARRIRFEGVSNPYVCDYLLDGESAGTGTRVVFTFELLRLELYMRPFEKLIRIAIQDGAERTVRNIKRLIEAEAAALASQ